MSHSNNINNNNNTKGEIDRRNDEIEHNQNHQQTINNSQQNIGKPPRPTGSLDRRRNKIINRQERDGKSHSTHSLKEKPSSNLLKDDLKGNKIQENGGNCRHENNFHCSNKFWDLPPPPPSSLPYTLWDQYINFQRSREELRMLDYHRRQHDAYNRFGSNGTLSNSQYDLFGSALALGNNCCSRYPPCYCLCDQRNLMGGSKDLSLHDQNRHQVLN